MVRASNDVARLRRLVNSGAVRENTGEYEKRHPNVTAEFKKLVRGEQKNFALRNRKSKKRRKR